MTSNLNTTVSEEQYKFREQQKELANLAVSKFSQEANSKKNLKFAEQVARDLNELFVAMAPFVRAYEPVDVSTTKPMARIYLDLHYRKFNIYLNYRGDVRIEHVVVNDDLDGYWYEGEVIDIMSIGFEPLAYICKQLSKEIAHLIELYREGYFEELSK